ncbi:MAG: glycosyltransferase family 2 protein [bacterium]|nr:glycosyltransferase family 2 protein [bacterium]
MTRPAESTPPPAETGGATPRRVCVVIPHAGGREILPACLRTLREDSGRCRVLLVDNASPDDSVAAARRDFPFVEVLVQERNLGFAGGCNAGLRVALADPACVYAVLLNNDTEPQPGWLEALTALLDAHPRLGAAQPRLLSIPFPGRLDYSGGAGGLLDVYAFPFALGRVLGHLEEDGENWREPRLIAWASGTACILRLEALREVGLLEESFFMHMEEIDLDWRLRLAGWEIASAPQGRVRHHSGYSLGAESPRKILLNHRNSLRMLVRNAGAGTLLRRLPVRLLLDGAAILSYLAAGRPRHAWAGLCGVGGWLVALPGDLRARHGIQAGRRVPEALLQLRHYPHSMALACRLGGRRTVAELGWTPPLLVDDREAGHV